MKIKEVRELEIKDLAEKTESAETVLVRMKLDHQIISPENPSQIKVAHRDIARTKTEPSQRELNK